MGFADHEGFRCGTAHAYPAFDLAADRDLGIEVRPLHVMDVTLRRRRQLDPEASGQRIALLAARCAPAGGTLGLLWHNTSMDGDWQPWFTALRRTLIASGLTDAERSGRRTGIADLIPDRLCILSLAPLAHDARVLRQIDHAAKRFARVDVVGWGELSGRPEHVRVHPISPIRLSPPSRAVQVALVAAGRLAPAAWRRWYWRKPDHRLALRQIIRLRPALIHANESIALPLALAAARETGARVLFDAHEYSLDHWTGGSWAGRLAAPLQRWLVTAHAPHADGMITVAPGLAERYARALGRPFGVVMNTPNYQEVAFRPCDPDRITLVHHGVALRARRLEDLIEVVARCAARYHLELMLVPADAGYIVELCTVAERKAPGRVRFAPPRAAGADRGGDPAGRHRPGADPPPWTPAICTACRTSSSTS